jgi:hypothetical protein
MPQVQYSNGNTGDIVSNLATALFGDPAARSKQILSDAQQQNALSAARFNNAKASGVERENQSINDWASALTGANPNIDPNLAKFLGTNIGAGFNPKQTADANLLLNSLNSNATPDQLSRASIGAGGIPNSNSAFTPQQGADIRSEDLSNKLQQVLFREKAKSEFGTGAKPKQYAVSGRTLEDIPYFALQNFKGAIKDGQVSPDVFSQLPPEVINGATTDAANAYSQTGNIQQAARVFTDRLLKDSDYQEEKKSWFGDIGDPNTPAGFVPRQQITPASGWGIKRIQ